MATASTAPWPARLRTYLELVRFSHTLFALPFAIMAALIALAWGRDGADHPGWPGVRPILRRGLASEPCLRWG